jgi:hypothetical protein
MEDNPGAYYHKADCERKYVLRQIAEARKAGLMEEVRRLEWKLDLVSYVGD